MQLISTTPIIFEFYTQISIPVVDTAITALQRQKYKITFEFAADTCNPEDLTANYPGGISVGGSGVAGGASFFEYVF